jgi:prepilin-type N-terminal cleavage/methylation domain-containing protein
MVANRRWALTLIELIVVLAVLAVLAGLAVPLITGTSDTARTTATNATLVQLRDIIMGTYRVDMNGQLPRAGIKPSPTTRQPTSQLRYLFINPGPNSATDTINPGPGGVGDTSAAETSTSTYNVTSRFGWRGPYLLTTGSTYPTPGTVFTNVYGESGDPTVLDGWLNPIVIIESVDSLGVKHAVLTSAGPDGIFNTATTPSTDDLILPLY